MSPICIYVDHHEIAAVLLRLCKSINHQSINQSINNFIFAKHIYFAYYYCLICSLNLKLYFILFTGLSIAAIHYNENCGRQQLVTENGDLCYNISYPKAKKGTETVVQPRKGPPSYGKFSYLLEDTSPKKKS